MRETGGGCLGHRSYQKLVAGDYAAVENQCPAHLSRKRFSDDLIGGQSKTTGRNCIDLTSTWHPSGAGSSAAPVRYKLRYAGSLLRATNKGTLMKISALGEAPDYRFSLSPAERALLAWIAAALGFLAASRLLRSAGAGFSPRRWIREVLALLLCLFAGVADLYGYLRWLSNEKSDAA